MSLFHRVSIMLQHSSDAERRAAQLFYYGMTGGLILVGSWGREEKSGAGVYIVAKAFYPYQSFAQAMKEQHPEASYSDISGAVQRGEPLYKASCELESDRCGRLWQDISLYFRHLNGILRAATRKTSRQKRNR